MLRGSIGNGAQFFRRSALNPWNRPQSMRTRSLLCSRAYLEPVTVPAPPRKDSLIAGRPFEYRMNANALRTNAKKLGEVRASMMSHMGVGQQQVPTLAERVNLQERWLAARLEGTRALKSAFTNLDGVLSDEQKKTANELLGPHMGMGMMSMMAGQMTPGPMGPGQSPGQIQPGQMPMQRPPAGNR